MAFPLTRLAPVTPRAPGSWLHRRLARRSHHRVRHDRAQPLRIRRPSHQLLYRMLGAAHSSVLTAFYVSDPTPSPIENPGTGVGGGGGGGGGQSVIAVFVLGFVFGAIHCAAWAYPFPSPVERTIWRVAVCAITAPFGFFIALTLVAVVLAVVVALITSIVWLILPRAIMDRIRGAVRYGVDHGLKPVLKVFTSIFRLLGIDSTLAIGIVFYVCLSVYAVARTAILVLSLASLRKLPSSALQTVDWVTLIPHI